ncbi:MAG: Gfo/Idh/MocA family protein, partial [Tumebacillaceae bacterium]
MEKTSSVRVGVIGCGVIGQRLLGVFTVHPEVEVAAVCDVSVGLAQATAQEFGVARWHTDYKELLADGDIDLVYVAVPPAYHHRIALDVLAVGKHIF